MSTSRKILAIAKRTAELCGTQALLYGAGLGLVTATRMSVARSLIDAPRVKGIIVCLHSRTDEERESIVAELAAKHLGVSPVMRCPVRMRPSHSRTPNASRRPSAYEPNHDNQGSLATVESQSLVWLIVTIKRIHKRVAHRQFGDGHSNSSTAMHRILSVSNDVSDRCWQRLLLERSGHGVVSASNAAEASSGICAGNIHAILLGSALGVHDRTAIALLGVTNSIPVVCMCGVQSEPGCPVVHVTPCDAPALLLSVLSELLETPHWNADPMCAEPI